MKLRRVLINLLKPYYLYENVLIQKGVIIHPYAVLGAPNYIEDIEDLVPLPKTLICHNVSIGSHVIIYEGAQIFENVVIEPYCRIGAKSSIGAGSRLIYGCRIHNNVQIGSGCTIAGNCSDNVVIGNNVFHFGRIAHKFNSPKSNWDETTEPSPIIEDDVVIGANALIIGPIKIGRNSYVAAGEVVRDSVPENNILYKGNLYTKDEWKGSLKTNEFFANERN